MPEPMPLGLTFLLAMVRAMVLASLVNSDCGGKVEMVFTSCTQRPPWALLVFLFSPAMIRLPAEKGANDVPPSGRPREGSRQ